MYNLFGSSLSFFILILDYTVKVILTLIQKIFRALKPLSFHVQIFFVN
jgi:hypothetical protein